MNRARLKKKISILDSKLLKAKDKWFEKIVKIVLKDELSEEEKIDAIENIFFFSLTESYVITSAGLKNIYHKIQDFTVEDIFNLTYSQDGKSIRDRIRDNVHKYDGEVLIYYLDRFLTNETLVIKNAVMRNKLQAVASLLVIECDEEDCKLGCEQYAGEYPPDESIQLPPYHPSCNCIAYYVETDNDDDIVDLDLEVEEVKE